ncbi:MAG TPA: SDR family NAD(P)-dependent oxidoreductase, partial [Macromonas sp.]|nr:SDR family NAD(P)-dependent oxidoreductase [Macromonas sp.]
MSTTQSWLAEEPRFHEGFAIVTGGSGGIGREVALTLARAGANVALTYGRNKAAADEVAEQIRALGRKAFVSPLAIEDAAAVQAFVDAAAAELGALHSVVYASGPGLHMQ